MTMDIAVATTDLDRLAERVEKAALIIHDLRAKLAQAETEKADLSRKLAETSGQLQGNDPAALLAELAALKKEQREWLSERKDVATRIETFLRKLERIEG